MKTRTHAMIRGAMLLLVAATFTLTGFAKSPDFSGKWKLNESESKLNAEFSFAPIQFNITQEKNSMTSERISNWQGQEFTMTNSYTLDGKESVNEGFQGAENVSIAKWEEDGKTLTITTTIEMMDGGELTIVAAYSMDGKKMVINNTVKGGPMGESSETWVYDKE